MSTWFEVQKLLKLLDFWKTNSNISKIISKKIFMMEIQLRIHKNTWNIRKSYGFYSILKSKSIMKIFFEIKSSKIWFFPYWKYYKYYAEPTLTSRIASCSLENSHKNFWHWNFAYKRSIMGWMVFVRSSYTNHIWISGISRFCYRL